MIKIILDPGHGAGKASNRGSLIGNEGDNNFYMAEEIKKALEPYEVQVDTTRKKITDNPSLTERSKAGEGYDVFLSLHTNAYNGKAKGSEVFRSLEHNNASNIALAKLINDKVAKYFVNRGVKTRAYPNTNNLNYYGVMRYNKAKHVFLGEFGFHDNKDDIKVIINKRKEIAQAVAQAFIQHFNLKLKPTENKGNKLYRIQIGAYSVKANADKALKEAVAKGYKDAFIVETGSATKPSEPIKPTIREGVMVSIRKGAKSYEGVTMASWVYNNKYRVDELKGDRAVLDKQGIHTAFNIKDLVI